MLDGFNSRPEWFACTDQKRRECCPSDLGSLQTCARPLDRIPAAARTARERQESADQLSGESRRLWCRGVAPREEVG